MKKVIFLFGQPGAGKGVQAELLSEYLGYYHFESSNIIESCFKKESPEKVFTIDGKDYRVADEIKKWETGELSSPPFVVNLMMEKIKDLEKEDKSIIFSGSPRTVYEAEKEIPLLKDLYGAENLTFFLLEITPETTIFRNSHRRICELMRHSILFSEETENLTLCPLDGSKIIRRKSLDDPETIKKRLKVFQEQTFPVIEFVKKAGIRVHTINGENSPAQVHEEILNILK